MTALPVYTGLADVDVVAVSPGARLKILCRHLSESNFQTHSNGKSATFLFSIQSSTQSLKTVLQRVPFHLLRTRYHEAP